MSIPFSSAISVSVVLLGFGAQLVAGGGPATEPAETGTAKHTTGRNASAVRTVSAATFGEGVFARDMILTCFGENLATSTEEARDLPLPNILAGTTLKLTDSRGKEGFAQFFFVSEKQVNWVTPDWLADGPVEITITSGAGTVSKGEIVIGNVAPGLFTANSTGEGVPAAVAVRAAPDGVQTTVAVMQCGSLPGSCAPFHLEIGTQADLVLLLFGTGIRHHSSISASIAGREVEVLAAQAQETFVGLDQVNIRIPPTLVGAGDAETRLIVDGKPSNAIIVAIGPAPHEITSSTPEDVGPGQTVSAFTLNGKRLAGVTGIRVYPPNGVSFSSLVATSTSVSAQLAIEADVALGTRMLCAISVSGHSNCIPLRILPGPIPQISNLSLTAGGTGVPWQFRIHGTFNFVDGDGDIVHTSSMQSSAKIDFKYIDCSFQVTGQYLDKRGQRSGPIEFDVQYRMRRLIQSLIGPRPLVVRLVDAAGNRSNALVEYLGLFGCPN